MTLVILIVLSYVKTIFQTHDSIMEKERISQI